MLNSRLLIWFSSLSVALLAFFSLSQITFAQADPWTPEDFVKIYSFTVPLPDIYEKTLPFSLSTTYSYTSTPCQDDSSCSSLGAAYVCLPNSASPPVKVCALPQPEARVKINIESTDYTPEKDTPQIVPKLQNLSQHYLQNPAIQGNLLNYGSLELLLPATYKLELKLTALERAVATDNALPEQVLGPMPNRSLTLPSGTTTTYLDLYNQLPSYLKTKPEGWQQQALSDPNPMVKAVSLVNPSPFDVMEWAYSYNLLRATVLGQEISKFEVVPYQVHPRGDLFTTYEYAKITLPNSVIEPYKTDPPIMALTDTTTLVSTLPTPTPSPTTDTLVRTYYDYLANLFPSTLDDTTKPEAAATQPTSGSFINVVLQFLGSLVNLESINRNFPSPSQITTNKLIALIGSQKITANELTTKPLDKKSFPVLTSVPDLKFNMGQGGGVSTLTDTFNRLIACEANIYSKEIPIKEYVAGTRQTCSGSTLAPPGGGTTSGSCYTNPNCNNDPTSEDLAGVKERFAEYAGLLLDGLGTPLLDQVDTVINQSIAAGVSPIFSLAIWLHESGGSNYDGICEYLGHGDPTSGYCQRILDFGINQGSIASTSSGNGVWNSKFSDQLSAWLDTPSYYLTSYCANEFAQADACPWGIFGSAFSPGTCTDIGTGSQYVTDVMNIYHFLSSTQAEPCYPITLP